MVYIVARGKAVAKAKSLSRWSFKDIWSAVLPVITGANVFAFIFIWCYLGKKVYSIFGIALLVAWLGWTISIGGVLQRHNSAVQHPRCALRPTGT